MRDREPRILGPYHESDGVRFIIKDGQGGRCSVKAPKEQEARRLAEATLKGINQAETVTVAHAIGQYDTFLREVKKNKPKSCTETTRRLRILFDAEAHGDRPLIWWTPARGAQRYEAWAKGVSVDYHRNTLAECKTFLAWCSDQARRWLKANPFTSIKGVGERRHGKAQLRPDEAMRWRDTAVQIAGEGDDGAVAALLLLDGGARSGEVVTRQVRDLIEEGHFVMVEAVAEGVAWSPKTKKSRRLLGPLPQDLANLLRECSRGKLPTGYLFPGRGGGPHDAGWVDDQVKKICRKAKVPVRCAHSMRGLRTTLDLLAGRRLRDVAEDRGHESESTTLTSYAAPGIMEQAQQERYSEWIARTMGRKEEMGTVPEAFPK